MVQRKDIQSARAISVALTQPLTVAEQKVRCATVLTSVHMDMCKVAREPWKSCFPATVATPQFSLQLIFKPDCCPWPHTSISVRAAYLAWMQGPYS